MIPGFLTYEHPLGESCVFEEERKRERDRHAEWLVYTHSVCITGRSSGGSEKKKRETQRERERKREREREREKEREEDERRSRAAEV